MSAREQPLVRDHLLARVIRSAVPGPLRRRWLRWRWHSRPLPQDWWPQFEREFRAYSGTAATRARRAETDF